MGDVISTLTDAAEVAEATLEHTKDLARLALDEGRLDAVRVAVEDGERLQAVVEGLQQMLSDLREEEDQADAPSRQGLGRLPAGVKTPDLAYRRPIATALLEMGGQGRVADVIDRVGELMRDILQPIDREPLRSEPHEVRWRNTAQWQRLQMVREGLLRADSPRGVWELTDEGRALAEGAE